jgi:LysR family transcriptional regulator (chromosome initiation inhibitor)
VAVNADSLATWFAPVLAGFAADAHVLLHLAVDDQDHTAEWLRSGAVLAAVTGTARPATGCSSRPLGAMRYRAAASPAFMARHFAGGVGAGSLAEAPCLVFDRKDELQDRWVRRLCHRPVELPRHTLPSPQAFVVAALGGMGWGLHPQALIEPQLVSGELVELLPDTPLDVPLHWQHARAASGLLEDLGRRVRAAAAHALLQPIASESPSSASVRASSAGS